MQPNSGTIQSVGVDLTGIGATNVNIQFYDNTTLLGGVVVAAGTAVVAAVGVAVPAGARLNVRFTMPLALTLNLTVTMRMSNP